MAAGRSGENEGSSFVSGECLYELLEHCFKTPYRASNADRKVLAKATEDFCARCSDILINGVGGYYSKEVPSLAWQRLPS